MVWAKNIYRVRSGSEYRTCNILEIMNCCSISMFSRHTVGLFEISLAGGGGGGGRAPPF